MQKRAQKMFNIVVIFFKSKLRNISTAPLKQSISCLISAIKVTSTGRPIIFNNCYEKHEITAMQLALETSCRDNFLVNESETCFWMKQRARVIILKKMTL